MSDIYPDLILPGFPGPLIPPTDWTVSGNTTLSQRINYFRNLTISGSSTLTGVAGGTIIVVQHKLQIDSGSILSLNGLGGIGGAASAVGLGGGAYLASVSNSFTSLSTGVPALHMSDTIAFPPVLFDPIQPVMASGGTTSANQPGGNGGAWSSTTAGAPTDISLFLALLQFITNARGHTDNATSFIGGGGGGGGANTSGSGSSTGGLYGQAGVTGTALAAQSGGSGFGGGGGGGSIASLFGGSTGVGANGGGVILILCGILSGAGTIRANGNNGTAPAANQGGGGGGGGGAVCVAYHIADSSTPTLQANGGTGGAPGGNGKTGGTGGAGVATSFRFNIGIASSI